MSLIVQLYVDWCKKNKWRTRVDELSSDMTLILRLYGGLFDAAVVLIVLVWIFLRMS